MKLTDQKITEIAELRKTINDVTDWDNPSTHSEMHTGNMLYSVFGQYLRTGVSISDVETDITAAKRYIAQVVAK